MEIPMPPKEKGSFDKGEFKIRWVERQGLTLEVNPIKIALGL